MSNPLDIARQFDLAKPVLSVDEIGTGNVNDTYLITTDAATHNKAILQRVNRHVFKNAEQIMANLRTISNHINQKISKAKQRTEGRWEFPAVIPTKSDSDFYLDGSGDFWRVIQFIENTITFETIENINQAKEVGNALGNFHRLTFDLEPSKLHDTLPGFHATPQYLARFDDVVSNSRPEQNTRELNYCLGFVENHRRIVDILERAGARNQLIQHVTHNDPKLNNILFDKFSLQAVGLIDLDTIKPGLLHYDIGDCLRSCCNLEGEESQNLEKVRFDPKICQAILSHYFSVMDGLLTSHDYHLIYDAIRLISFELGLRFLIDYLEGDVYFKTTFKAHNLQRALIQFKLTESIESQEDVIKQMST